MNGPRFSIIPAWIVTDSRLKGSDLKVLCLLGTYTDKEGWCRRSQVKMAEQLNCGRSTIQDCLNRLAEIGAVEKHREVSKDGRDSAHWYRVVLDRTVASNAFSAWEAQDEQELGPISGDVDGTPPAGTPAPLPVQERHPPAGSGPAPINGESLTPQSNEKEREGACAGSKDDQRKIEKQLDILMIGRHGNPWPKVLGSSRDWTMRQFLSLTPEERQRADDCRDAYLAACPKFKAGEDKGKPNAVALGVYLRDKMFNYVDAVAPRSVERQKARHAENDKIPVAPFGPIWAGLRMMDFLDGPVDVEMPDNVFDAAVSVYEVHRRTSPSRAQAFLDARGITVDGGQFFFPEGYYEQERARRIKQAGYPRANRLHKLERETADPRNAVFSDLCEAVDVTSHLYDRWRQYHEQNNLPFVPDPVHMRVVWFPKGGPEGLSEFEMAARAALGMERDNDDAR